MTDLFVQTLRRGINSGLKTTFELGKVIFPVTLVVSLLQHTPVLPILIDWMSPVMQIFGLPGEAAVPLVLGNLLNIYAAIGAILSLKFTVKEVFILAIMLSFSHNLLIETSVALKSGVKLWVVLSVRLGLAFFSAVIIHLVWSGGGELAQYGMIQPQEETFHNFGAIFLNGLGKAASGVFQLAIIVIPLMIFIQILKDYHFLQYVTKALAPVTRMLGMKENTALTLSVGLLFGLAFGAGVLLKAVKEDGVSRKDATLAFIFLMACHAVVEDTLIFVPLGIPVLPLLMIRLITAFLLTYGVAKLIQRLEAVDRKEMSYEK